MGYQFVTIQYEIRKGVCSITLSRPEVKNALNRTMLTELLEVFEFIGQDPLVQIVLIKANKDSFCSGSDFSELPGIKESSTAHQYGGLVTDMFNALQQIRVPVISMVEGPVYGNGIGFLAVSDIVIAEEDVVFCFNEMKTGLIPALISSYIIKRTGLTQSRYFILSGREFYAPEALSFGLVSRTVSPGTAEEFTSQLITEMLDFPVETFKACKSLFDTVSKGPYLETIKEYSRNVFVSNLLNPDTQNRLEALKRVNDKSGNTKKKKK